MRTPLGRLLSVLVVMATAASGTFADEIGRLYREGKRAATHGDFSLAISRWTAVLEKRPKDVLAYRWRADAYAKKGEYDRAIEDCSQAIRINPTNAAAYNDRGVSYLNLQDLESALSDFNEGIRLS